MKIDMIPVITAFFLLCGVLPLLAQTEPFSLQENDVIVFLGDSITQSGAQPGGYVYLTSQSIATAYPHLNIRVIGAGISGNKVPDCQQRLDRDVLQREPTIVVIYIGINDVWHWRRDQGTEKNDFEEGLRDLLARTQSAGARVILCTPTVIGEKTDGTNRFDEMLEEYSDITRSVAADMQVQLLDLRAVFIAHLKEHNTDNAEQGILTTDGVHMNPNGNKLLAQHMLKALNVPAMD